ncbi:hypothetical protein BH11PAT2_BH11PAT2_07190 [soil metagenome]
MKDKTYPYIAQFAQKDGTFKYRPYLDIIIASTESEMHGKFKALVDSGSDITVMDSQIAEFLGIDKKGKEAGRMIGVVESREGFLAKVNIEVLGFPEVMTFTVLFIEDLTTSNYDVLLGQQDFFKRFVVSFDGRRNSFSLRLSPTEDEILSQS